MVGGGLEPAGATLFAFMVPNQVLFPEAHYDTNQAVAVAGQFEQGEEFLGMAAMSEVTNHCVAEFPLPLDALTDGNLGDATISCDDELFVRPKEQYTNYPLVPGSPHVGAMMAYQFDLGLLAPGESKQVDLVYAYGASESEVISEIEILRDKQFDSAQDNARRYWREINEVQFGDKKLDNLFLAARAGMQAGVADSGRMNVGV